MERTQDRNTVLLSGYAKLPTNTTAENVYQMLAVAVLFDKRSGIIVEAEASMVTSIARSFISRLLVGSDYKEMLPTSMLLGAVVLLAADTVGRTIVPGMEIPVA